MLREVGARHRAAEFLEIGGDGGSDVAAIEIGEAGMDEMLERVGELPLAQPRAGFGRLAVDEEMGREARNRLQFVEVARRHLGLRPGDDDPLAGAGKGIAEQVAPRQPPAEGAGGLARRLPAGYRAGDRERRIGAAIGQPVVAAAGIVLDRRQRAGPARCVDDLRRPVRLGDEEEGIAARPVHVRVDHGDRCRRRDHRLDRVAAGPHHFGAGLGRRAMRRHHHPLFPDDRLVHACTPLLKCLFIAQ